MVISKNKLRFALSVWLSLSFSTMAGAADIGSGGALSGTGMSLSTVLSNPANQAAIQANTPSATEGRGDTAAKSQERDAKMADAPNQERVTGKDDAQFKSEFQIFVTQSVGHALPMYGYDLFLNAPSTFAPLDRTPVTPDYTIGPGDELLVHVWGQVEASENVVVDRNGMINLPKIGQVSVVGVRYQNLQAHLKAAIGRMFRNFELDVSLGKLRSIQVFVVGQAKRPGNYTVSSLSTLVNALFASGGPSAKGSMRHIQLKRANKVITEFDLYDLLLKGDKSKDVQLLPGDVIYIPTIGAMAAIAGSVNTPAIFELKSKETLSGLLELAGGLTNVAAGQKVAIERIHEREMRKVDEFQLDKDGLAKALHDGDLVTVYSISARFDNAVTLRGNIATPGRHPWKEGLRISDVIPDKGTLITDSYWLKQNQTARMDVSGSDKLRNEVKRSLAEVNWDYAVVERLNPKDLTTSLIPFNLGKAIIDHDPVQDLLLQPGDVITIFSKDDIQVSVDKHTKYVTFEGEIAIPGVYQVQQGETLRQLVARLGGVTPRSYLRGSIFTRESVREFQQKNLNEAIDKMEVELRSAESEASSSAMIRPEDAAVVKGKIAKQYAILASMRNIKAAGRIVLELPEEGAQIIDLPDIALEDGDRFTVPSTPSTVSVFGAVYNQSTFLHKHGKVVDDYLEKAGGATRDGDAENIYVVLADGTVKANRSTTFFGGGLNGRELKPGDLVFVPQKIDVGYFSLTKTIMDWTQILYQLALTTAGGKAAGMW